MPRVARDRSTGHARKDDTCGITVVQFPSCQSLAGRQRCATSTATRRNRAIRFEHPYEAGIVSGYFADCDSRSNASTASSKFPKIRSGLIRTSAPISCRLDISAASARAIAKVMFLAAR
jgi:hypothetical protein